MGSCQREFEEIVLRAYAPMYGFRGPTAVEDFRRYISEQTRPVARVLNTGAAVYLDPDTGGLTFREPAIDPTRYGCRRE